MARTSAAVHPEYCISGDFCFTPHPDFTDSWGPKNGYWGIKCLSLRARGGKEGLTWGVLSNWVGDA
jgi:hypothetical protein